MWFILSLITIFFWGGSDLFSKIGSPEEDKYSHWRIVMAVGGVMGIHALIELICGVEFNPIDFIYYSPAIICYVLSMILGYVGLRYIMLSVSSPICNSSGAVACVLCLIFLKQNPGVIGFVGIALVLTGVILLAFVERQKTTLSTEDKKYHKGFIAIFFPIFYCILDGLGTFADAIILDSGKINEDSANIAYELTFLAMAIFAYIYVVLIKKQALTAKTAKPKLAGALCETAGQFTYIYALGDNPTVAAPMISAYCVFSVVLSRIFLKEKLSLKHYLVIFTVFAGIIILGISEVV